MNKTRMLATALMTTVIIQSTASAQVHGQNQIDKPLKYEKMAKNSNAMTGRVEVELELLLPIQTDGSNLVKGTLSNEKESYDLSVQSDMKSQKLYGVVTGCKPGQYTLTLKGTGFQTFTQEVQVEASMASKLYLKNSHELDDMYIGDARPGVMGYGDVTGDGIINQSDMDAMMNALKKGLQDVVYDLNQDGTVDLLDASYITYNLEQSNIPSTVLKVLSMECVEDVKVEGEVIGSLEDILSDHGSVQLKPKNEEAISESNPVEIELAIAGDATTTEAITIAAPANSENAITEGVIMVEDQDGTMYEAILQSASDARISTLTENDAIKKVTATVEADGSIVVDLNGQIAIKKVSIKVTGTKSRNLAEIAQVQFLNDMDQRIAPPELSVPQNVTATAGNKEFTVKWNKSANVTGYQLEISAGGVSEIITTGSNQAVIKQFQNDKLKNGTKYQVRVLAINGDWRSEYSEAVTVIPKATTVPDAPENITIEGGYQLLNLSWKAMEDTDSYQLSYREKGTENYKTITEIKTNKYQLNGLKANTTYEVYLEGVNEFGVGKKSKVSLGTTTELEYAKTSNYKLINVPTDGKATAHIKSVEYPCGIVDNEFAIVDNDYSTDWIMQSWTTGGYSGNQIGPIVTFDDYYTMDRIIMVESTKQTYDYFYSRIRYWDKDGKEHVLNDKPNVKYDASGLRYYEYNLSKPITTDKIQISLSNYLAYDDGMISLAELKFYYYDTLEEDIYNLFADDTHVTLKQNVTIDDIDALAKRLEMVDEVSGEYHYKKAVLEIELQNARNILGEVALREPLQLDVSVTKAKDNHTGFIGGLNAWQPLGITAHEGEELVLYVGKSGAKVGEGSRVKLIATQYHAESGTWMKEVVQDLKVGRNEVTIPKISSMAVEHGGSIYVEYTGNNPNDVIEVRVSGGTPIPVLNVSKLVDEAEKKAAIRDYLEQLTAHVDSLEARHNELHKDQEGSHCNYDYDKKNCILNTTEIILDQMMYSVAAEQVLSGIRDKAGSDDVIAMVDAMYQSLQAMDQMMNLYYHHKGFGNYPTDAAEYAEHVKKYGDRNKMPSSRLNFRYMRMFAGAFMYAGGLHMGIEWDSVPGLMTSTPVQTDEFGKYLDGQLFGWGIAHEIGHTINQKDYEVAEVTNNYFALLSTAKGTNESVRWDYADVYEKVTSGTIGASDNGAVRLAMYWQLHLAYDAGFQYQMYDTYEEQFNNLIYARMDAYARNNTIAPTFADGSAFTLSDATDKDNKLMRLACAATKKNLLEFFQSWGMVPDETTLRYASQFDKEERRIQYITDDAKAYRIEHASDASTIGEKTAAANVQATLSRKDNSNQVTISLQANGMHQNSILGYEILRNGKVVGFVDGTKTQFVDTVPFNNQVATYSVIAYDKFLNATEANVLDAVKIKHDGSLSKDTWSITTNMKSEHDEQDKDDICGVNPIQAVYTLIDNDVQTSYTGSVTSGNPEVVLNLGEMTQIMGMKVTLDEANPLRDYEILGSVDGANWTLIQSGTFSNDAPYERIYFTKENALGAHVALQNVSYVKLVLKGQQTVTLKEIDLIGQPDDNVELVEAGIGKLANDFVVDESNLETIAQGSVVITGEYSGHPAYNVVLLIDADTDEVIPGSQYIFAQDPDDSDLGAVSQGTWLYVIEPEEDGTLPILPKRVKAELYRVDNAHTMEGQRFVSDTLIVDVPETLNDLIINQQQSHNTK